ncbi:MAG: cell wall-active antibiotics response protein, partial [Ignavibacteriaceae bacterium]|nr:cell wall-active antibiotics response protein [Ignavibacteriaceae bacterium]
NNDSEAKVRFKMKKTRIKFTEGKFQNKVEMKLNPQPIWYINFDAGASSANIDLSKFKIMEANFDMGAASMDLKLGSPLEETKVSIDAGASSITIRIPEGAASEIRVDAALSSKSFDGFEKINSELYRTANFNDSVNKFIITIDSGVSSIDVTRY